MPYDPLDGDVPTSRADEVNESSEIVVPLLEHWQRRVSTGHHPAGVPGEFMGWTGCFGGWQTPTWRSGRLIGREHTCHAPLEEGTLWPRPTYTANEQAFPNARHR